MTQDTTGAEAPAGGSTEGPPLALTVTATAHDQLKSALAGKSAGTAVRLFVGGGAHPQIGMSLDAPSARDLRFEVEGLPFVVDPGSRPFLDEARVDYVATAEASGFHITGPNAPGAAEAASAAEGSGAAGPAGSFDSTARAALKKVYDPEIPMNIVDLGLIYGLEQDDSGHAKVTMTMTSPGCPVVEMLLDQIKEAVRVVPGVTSVDVDVVWEPAWSPDRMSEFAKRQLGFA